MSTKTPAPLLRLVPWLLLVAAAYAVGRWHGGAGKSMAPPGEVESADGGTAAAVPPPEEDAASEPRAKAEPAPRAERVVRELDALAVAARSMPVPDARTYAFFEKLSLDDMAPVVTRIEGLPPGNEQDVLFIMAIRRWAELDGEAALARAASFPALGTRVNARLTAFESWGAHDPAAAFARALREKDADAVGRAAGSVLTGAATTDPRQATELWLGAPEEFRSSAGGAVAAAQIAGGAFGTGKREIVQEIVAGLPEGVLRTEMIDTLVEQWGTHYPDEAYVWLEQVVADPEARETAVNGLFSSLVQKDPALAALWASDYPDETRRTSYIAAAIQAWARVDTVAAETWVNEQPSGRYLDGAGYAMAAHFMARRDMTRSFSWIRRINLIEMRAELLGTLGRMWAKENPAEFKKFLDEASLNRAEVEMLLAKIPPPS